MQAAITRDAQNKGHIQQFWLCKHLLVHIKDILGDLEDVGKGLNITVITAQTRKHTLDH